MAKLAITKINGEKTEHEITPFIEWSFEQYAKKGFHRAFREDEKQTDVYWLAWKCLSQSETVVPFGEEFIKNLALVEVLDSDPLAQTGIPSLISQLE